MVHVSKIVYTLNTKVASYPDTFIWRYLLTFTKKSTLTLSTGQTVIFRYAFLTPVDIYNPIMCFQ